LGRGVKRLGFDGARAASLSKALRPSQRVFACCPGALFARLVSVWPRKAFSGVFAAIAPSAQSCILRSGVKGAVRRLVFFDKPGASGQPQRPLSKRLPTFIVFVLAVKLALLFPKFSRPFVRSFVVGVRVVFFTGEGSAFLLGASHRCAHAPIGRIGLARHFLAIHLGPERQGRVVDQRRATGNEPRPLAGGLLFIAVGARIGHLGVSRLFGKAASLQKESEQARA